MFLEQLSPVIRVRHHRPWSRALVDIEGWRLAGTRLADGAWTLVSLWGEQDAVHAADLGRVPGRRLVGVQREQQPGRLASMSVQASGLAGAGDHRWEFRGEVRDSG